MPVRVKICGITNQADADAAVEAGADALGFILYERSPRYISPAAIADISRHLPPFLPRVAVAVNPTLAQIEDIERTALFEVWQLHGEEPPALCAGLARRRRVKAFHLQPDFNWSQIQDYNVEGFLLDTPSAQYGGTGQTFDWSLARQFQQHTSRPLILSGGLNPENVASAVEQVHPYAVDVSSGVEVRPGQKDHHKLRDFIQICKSLT
jgi:phosphoribosylanthranilate isomerase